MNKTLKKIVTFLALPIIVPVVVGTMWLASRSDYKDFEKKSKKKIFFYVYDISSNMLETMAEGVDSSSSMAGGRA